MQNKKLGMIGRNENYLTDNFFKYIFISLKVRTTLHFKPFGFKQNNLTKKIYTNCTHIKQVLKMLTMYSHSL